VIVAAPLGLFGIIAVVVGVFGLAIGSFVNVVVYRVPNGMSIVSPPSACPSCGMPIKAFDNVPVVSWLVLRGRCRGCATAISRRYPLVELGTGIFFAAVCAWYLLTLAAGTGPETPAHILANSLVLVAFLYLAAVSVSLALIDLDVHKLPNKIVLPSYAVGAVLLGTASLLTGDYWAIARLGIGLVASWIAYFAMAFAYPGGMGFGDVKLAGLIGLYLGWLGWGALATGTLAAFLVGGLFAVILVITGRANRKSGIPFGPWMLVGAWLGIGIGDAAFGSYLSIFGLSAA
jgi:leader peptidase (prepilin peptidase) / N-methyltransferase